MTGTTRLATSLLFAAGSFLMIRQGFRALDPARPPDMPANSYFLQSGYNLQRNEPLGQWIACRPDPGQSADLCRVTDHDGQVIFEGEYLPLHGSEALPEEELRIATRQKLNSLWVRGPAENGPVPVIPLANGKLLVPVADNDALADRWAKNPDELNRITGQ